MHFLYTSPFKYLLALAFTLQFSGSFCQTLSPPLTTKNIAVLETAILEKKMLLETQQELESLKQQALQSHNDILYARTLFDLMKIKDQRTEDTLYFRNSAFMDTLLQANITSKLKAILYLMRAQRISGFDSRPKRFNFAAYRTKDLNPNYAALNRAQRDSLVSADLKAAIQCHDQTIAGHQLLWISSNPSIFLFEPKFEDIVLAEHVNLVALQGYFNNEQLVKSTAWLALPSTAFRNKLDSLSSNTKNNTSILSAYQRWLAFNKTNPATSSFIESLVRKYIYLSAPTDSVTKQYYVNYLQECIASPYAAVKAHSVYQLCLIWNEEGNRYASFGDRYSYQFFPNFNPQYQFCPTKALQLYQEHHHLIKQYPLFSKVLELMAKQIESKGIRIEMEDQYLPNEAIPIKAIYRNVDTLYYRIIKISSTEFAGKDSVSATADLLLRHPLVQGSFALPSPPDHNRHAVYLKLSQLPIGRYRLLFSNTPIKAGGNNLSNIVFNVTAIAAINTDERIFVLHRKTGFPLAGAQIKMFKKKVSLNNKKVVIIGAKGFINVEKADSINIVYKGDTTGYKFNVKNNNLDDEVYSKDEYDDLTEFHDDHVRMEIFTDRSIYRPGQTVHYKMIFLTKDPKTGYPILFNRQNLGGGIFKTRLKKWLDDENDEITLHDPFGKKIDSATFQISDFGSFAGSFIIPKNAATGEWQIEGMPETSYTNNGSFKVEEYKRPTIELSVEKQKKMLRPGEPFVAKFKLRSLNGADLGNIPVNYTIHRNGRLPAEGNRTKDYSYKETELIHQTGYTNNKGELLVTVNDLLVAKAKLDNNEVWNFNYAISATAVDATGESTEVREVLTISSRPIKINLPLSKTYDRQNLPVLNISTTADFEGTVGKMVDVKLYKITDPDLRKPSVKYVDQWYYDGSDWNAWFPAKAENTAVKEEKTLLLDTMINTAIYEKLILNKADLKEGFYQVEAECNENGRLMGKAIAGFNVFDSKATEIPINDIDYMPVNGVKPGDWVTWYSSSKKDRYTIYQLLYVAGNKRKTIKNIYQTRIEKTGVSLWKYQVPADATDQIVINKISITENKIETLQKRIYIDAGSISLPDIIVEKYRKVMAPGTQETFTLSVKTKNVNVAAEILTTLYDASLDKLEPHSWKLPNTAPSPTYLYTSWNYSLTFSKKAGNYVEGPILGALPEFEQGTPGAGVFNAIQGRVAGVSLNNASGLNEVVVVGYGVSNRQFASSASTIMIRGASSLLDYNQPLIIVDGEIFTGDLKDVNTGAINQAMILKGADATALYGARAASGVLIISTKGPIVWPVPEPPVIKVRKNFNETAFFFPQVHAGADGYYTFSFTMPETATEWNWKMLAHTRKAKFAYLEKKLQTQLNLMIQPNMPRLLYQGDLITLQSRITNLDTSAIQGNAICKIEDAVTGQDITAILTAHPNQPFKLNQKSSGAVSFLLHVPAQQTNPLKIIISATSGSASDAEEHIVPVLSTQVFTRQSQALHFTDQPKVTLAPVKLPSNASLYGMGISIDQKPAASLIYALPWLANYSYDCAEQTFNKLRAQVTALRLIQKDTTIQKAFKKAAANVAQEKPTNVQLPDELADETMPWLGLGNHSVRQQTQLFHLLDTVITKNSMDTHLEKLYQLQQPDGGLTWFEGGKSNAYISAYILAGFGQLKQMGWIPEPRRASKQGEFIRNLLKYQENLFSTSSGELTSDLFGLYAISYWNKAHPLIEQIDQKVNLALSKAWDSMDHKNLEQQALLVINTLRFTTTGETLNKRAHAQLENIRQLAIQDPTNGLRWKDIADTEELNNGEEETMALLAEAFELSGKYQDVQSGIVKWLLTARQDEHWQTTKATAAAVGLLQKNKEKIFDGNKALSAQLNGRELSVSDDLLNGVPTAMATINELPQSITIQQQGTNSNGNLTWYYFAEPSKLDTLHKGIKINKQFFSYNNNKDWIPLNSDTVLKEGDRVLVKLSIETVSRLKFVHINDPRSAAFEPKENNSGYRFTNGFGYYQSIRDTGLDLFAEVIPKGISVLTYELIVAHSGEFTSGPASLQCMYQPAQTAYSNVMKIKTKSAQ